MTKQNEQEALGAAMSKTEEFFEKNSKRVSVALLAIFVLAAAVFGYRQLISQPRNKKAAEMIAEAQYRFEAATPDYRLALEGDANGAGFLEVIDRYGATKTGNLAKHYAGICYLRLGELENAADYLARFKPMKGIPAQIINAQNLGLQGDVAVERADYPAAIRFFEKAVASSDNDLTAPMYLHKAALAANAAGNAEQAIAFAQRILDEYPASVEARNAEKLIGSFMN
ncbi:MAG: tetratricopeptide repeat protein [Alistipes sp.]|nr:tetratricopeptide repeat protein [Alistipes sp.]